MSLVGPAPNGVPESVYPTGYLGKDSYTGPGNNEVTIFYLRLSSIKFFLFSLRRLTWSFYNFFIILLPAFFSACMKAGLAVFYSASLF